MLSCGDSYNGVFKRLISSDLDECKSRMNDWLKCKCSQSYCYITKHVDFHQTDVMSQRGTNKPENPWD